ncbi:hypothetical protein [Candidatus Uabimicrobium amorphum]|uniref:Uncharacterized protein n=1 Tax=Uabimicrobium amorphum TaxID=2596890 RepID=A0A5S9F4J9_UABAM|nr:hypothetical protein [Candidatus Uabimicrobium amorphum]BBM85628.1 hypothetical protein UABAM_04002 [Candidatus Uabimicrobium amorphum]
MDVNTLTKRYIHKRHDTLYEIKSYVEQSKDFISLVEALDNKDVFIREGIVSILVQWGPDIAFVQKIMQNPHSFLLKYFRALLEKQQWCSLQLDVKTTLYKLQTATKNYTHRAILRHTLMRKTPCTSQIQKDIEQSILACLENSPNHFINNFLKKHMNNTSSTPQTNLQIYTHVKWCAEQLQLLIPRGEWSLRELIAACAEKQPDSFRGAIVVSLEYTTILHIDTHDEVPLVIFTNLSPQMKELCLFASVYTTWQELICDYRYADFCHHKFSLEEKCEFIGLSSREAISLRESVEKAKTILESDILDTEIVLEAEELDSEELASFMAIEERDEVAFEVEKLDDDELKSIIDSKLIIEAEEPKRDDLEAQDPFTDVFLDKDIETQDPFAGASLSKDSLFDFEEQPPIFDFSQAEGPSIDIPADDMDVDHAKNAFTQEWDWEQINTEQSFENKTDLETDYFSPPPGPDETFEIQPPSSKITFPATPTSRRSKEKPFPTLGAMPPTEHRPFDTTLPTPPSKTRKKVATSKITSLKIKRRTSGRKSRQKILHTWIAKQKSKAQKNDVPIFEVFLSEQAGIPGVTERIFAKSKMLMKTVQLTIGLRFLLLAYAMDNMVQWIANYVTQIFSTWRTMRSIRRKILRTKAGTEVSDLCNEIEKARHEICQLFLWNQPQSELCENFPLKYLIELRERLDCMKRDLNFLNRKETMQFAQKTWKDFLWSFLPNPLEFIAMWKDWWIITFHMKYCHSELQTMYLDFLLAYRRTVRLLDNKVDGVAIQLCEKNIIEQYGVKNHHYADLDQSIIACRQNLQRLIQMLVKPRLQLTPQEILRTCQQMHKTKMPHPYHLLELERLVMKEVKRYYKTNKMNMPLQEKQLFMRSQKDFWLRYQLQKKLRYQFQI